MRAVALLAAVALLGAACQAPTPATGQDPQVGATSPPGSTPGEPAPEPTATGGDAGPAGNDPTPGASPTAGGSPEPTAAPTASAVPGTGAPEPAEGFTAAVLTLVGDDGEHQLAVEVAADRASRQQGLMHRDELDPDAGMLFLFPTPTSGGFWMKNTLIPLSIAFLDADGRILRVLDMQPCTEEPCEVYRPGVTYVAALEVNLGRFAELGVSEGDQVVLPDDLPAAS